MSLAGTAVRIEFLGCRVNAAEAEALASAFLSAGASVASDGPFDVGIVVTCSITAMADRKSRQLIGRLRRRCPRALLVASGCWAQGADEALAKKLGIDLLVGNGHKGEILALVERELSFRTSESSFYALRSPLAGVWDELDERTSVAHSRAFIKVQDGCDCRCSYCIVPSLRGPSVSRPLERTVAEARRLVEAGRTELVLTGVHLGQWGKESGRGLADLIEAVGNVPGLKRLRLGSLEPFGIDERDIDAMASLTVFAPHLHLPLQSGDDGVLRRMRRPGTSGQFLELVKKLRRALGDGLHVSTDVMVAFPGETDEAFARTLEVLQEARIGRIHGFIFSIRPGTPAARFPDQVDRQTGKRRLEELERLGRLLLDEQAARSLGRSVVVYAERGGKGAPSGYTGDYIEVHLPASYERDKWCTVQPIWKEDGVLYLERPNETNRPEADGPKN
ncbi:radical SAM methylthiotransferase, MiaB/RimO family [Jonquetella anthropi DSM 22815]|uniref:Radical SAM methylthiotransferase, MiaB/RimO family n=1 Tax=Jonquetella anthropi DSM 22815 TaxID=885272 RepID=H0UM38_9BACT|nr:MiaB/RimO family radical SAM methylthiotransferase [Jonquetella anthropi]EHM13614.1 radical SAM methylthiotransferase, MiaB/RimO family [Jonquetella anthropi DSM 22815]